MKESTIDNTDSLSELIETVKDLIEKVEEKIKRQQAQYFSGYPLK